MSVRNAVLAVVRIKSEWHMVRMEPVAAYATRAGSELPVISQCKTPKRFSSMLVGGNVGGLGMD